MPADIVEGFEEPTANTQMDDFRQRFTAIKTKKKQLDNYIENNLQEDLGQLQTAFTPYVTSCGTTNATAPAGSQEQTVADRVAKINERLTKYKTEVLNPLAALRRDILAFLNINGKTQEISKLVEENEQLVNELKEVNDGLSTAYNREVAIDTRDKAVSYNQTWGYLNRPLRRNSIPILIVFALIFAGVGLVGLYYLSPYATISLTNVEPLGFLQQPAVWMTLALGAILAVILISLKLAGQL
jgi:phage FluMu protein gp41